MLEGLEEEYREFLFLIIGILAGILGSLLNYTYWKYIRNKEMTRQGSIKALILGAGAGLVTWIGTDGGIGLHHVIYLWMCLISGMTAESIIGKMVGAIKEKVSRGE